MSEFDKYGAEALGLITAYQEKGPKGATDYLVQTKLDHDRLTLVLASIADGLVKLAADAAVVSKERIMEIVWGPSIRDNLGEGDGGTT